MFQSLEVFQLSHKMAVHAGRRQAVISQNVANADTPEYVARDLPKFSDVVEPNASDMQRATRAAHLHGVVNGRDAPILEDTSHASINGNTVSIEKEMLRAVETKRQHDRALAIYKSAMTVLQKTLQK